MQFKENIYVEYAFRGIRVGVSILILNAAIRMYKKLNKNWLSFVLLLVGFFFILFELVPVIYVIIIGGVVGISYQLIITRGDNNA
jgi:chromate transporter